MLMIILYILSDFKFNVNFYNFVFFLHSAFFFSFKVKKNAECKKRRIYHILLVFENGMENQSEKVLLFCAIYRL